jgi:hypothetical protein
VRAVKAALGLTGVKCSVDHNVDSIIIRPQGLCQIAFANFRY